MDSSVGNKIAFSASFSLFEFVVEQLKIAGIEVAASLLTAPDFVHHFAGSDL